MASCSTDEGESYVEAPVELWPTTIIEDRYGGGYSNGNWIAIAEADLDRLALVWKGALGEDIPAAKFWDTYSNERWIAVGNSPDEALANLIAKNS
jgi:hypothetical protein